MNGKSLFRAFSHLSELQNAATVSYILGTPYLMLQLILIMQCEL